MVRNAIALALALAVAPAHAQEVFKCVDSAGKVEYRNSACPLGTNSGAVDQPITTGQVLEIRRSDQRDIGLDAQGRDIAERPVAVPRVSRPSEPVNALPPPPAPNEAKR